MYYYAGLDVSLESVSICVVDGSGGVIREARVSSTPEGLVDWFGSFGGSFARIGLEAGPLSQWLYAGLCGAGLPAELIETRHVRSAFRTMPVKTDRKDALGIAHLMRLGWFKPVHCKSVSAQEVRALLTSRKLVQVKLHDVEMSLRGVLRGFGLKVGHVTPRGFEARIEELVSSHPSLQAITEVLLKARASLRAAFRSLDKQARDLARRDPRSRLLMTAPGVGTIVALTYVSAIDDPGRLKSSKSAGPLFGLTPRRYQSGEIDIQGRITKCGDRQVRTALYEAAHIILTRPIKGGWLKSWAARIATRAGMRKAKVALARRLAVVLHRMLADETPFIADKAALQA